MVKRYHGSFPSFSYEFDSRYPLQKNIMTNIPYHTALLAPQLRTLGIPMPWSFGLADRTRYSELDPVGHVNNVAYLQWFEAFRVHYLVDYGIAYSGDDSPFPVLRRVEVDYLAEMNLREDYVVTGRTKSMRNTSIEMEYAVWSDGALRTTGSAVLVFLTKNNGRFSLTDEQRETLRSRDGTIDAR